MKGLIDEVKKLGNIILMIDEIHNIVGAGDAEGSMNAANILKPALSRGEIQVIGATTFNEYRKSIEKDSALERRFQPVTVNEPSIEDSIKILKGLAPNYEAYHGVKISDGILRQAVLLSERYITDRFLPDKAIDLIDKACSDLNLKDPDISRRMQLQREIDDFEKERAMLEEQGAQEGAEPDYEQIATLKSKILQRQTELNTLLLKGDPQLTMENIAHVIELWTKIPASKIREEEFQRLSQLEERLKSHIVGQDEAIAAVSAAVRRNRVGISPKHKPVSFIFVGSTGVGKTELVKQLAVDLFNTPDALIRLDMSEFMEKHSVSRIVGSPPGYVGYDEAGQLTEKIRRKPYAVILFDEIEKAHPDVLNVLLQILDDGEITDSHGRRVNFENTIIVMTSNAGSGNQDGGTVPALTAVMNNDGIFKVDPAAVGIGDLAVIQNLQQHVQHVRMGLFDLVEQNDGVGLPADLLRQLARLVIAHIARRGAYDPGNGVLFHKFRHIQTDQRVRGVEQVYGQLLHQLRLAHAGGADENKADGLVLGGDSHPVPPHGGGHRRDGLVLSDDVTLEPLLQLAEPLEFLLPDLGGRDLGPQLDNVGDILHGQLGITLQKQGVQPPSDAGGSCFSAWRSARNPAPRPPAPPAPPAWPVPFQSHRSPAEAASAGQMSGSFRLQVGSRPHRSGRWPCPAGNGR